MEGEGSDKIGLPIQRKDYDLTKDTDKTDNPPEALSHDDSRFRSPAALMRQMGFDPTSSMTPLQFMTAVYNDDLEKIFKPGKRLETYKSKGGIALSYRLEAAKTAAKYIHPQAPVTVIGKHEHDTFASELNRNIEAGNTRVTRRVQILETVEKISPDVPLPPTNLPAAFADIDGEAIVMQQDEGDDFDYTPN